MRREKLIAARKRKGLSQEVVAGLLGVTRNTYSQWELGNAEPYPYNIGQICKFFGVKDLAELDLVASQQTALSDVELPSTTTLWADDLLTIYDRGIAACRDLFFSGSPLPVEAILPLYCNQTTLLTKESSSLRQPAAKLASYALRLASELATDREDFGSAEQAGKEAFFYARLAEDANLQVAALIILANLAFHRKLSTAALATYQQAVSLLSDKVTPLLQGRTYAGLAEIYAMRGQLQDAMRAMGLAYELYPQKPEEDPAYPYIRASRYALYVFGDVQLRLFLGQPKEAEHALIAMQKETNDPQFEPITKLDMLYYQADVQVLQGDLESSNAVLTEAALLAKELGSKLYFNKLAVTYHNLQLQSPREPRVLAMEEVFQPW
jgi:transcriptional regulator with XRE-family HTH domain